MEVFWVYFEKKDIKCIGVNVFLKVKKYFFKSEVKWLNKELLFFFIWFVWMIFILMGIKLILYKM